MGIYIFKQGDPNVVINGGSTGGLPTNTHVIKGTTGTDSIEIMSMASVELSANFKNGVDNIRIHGNSGDFNVKTSTNDLYSTNVLLTNTNATPATNDDTIVKIEAGEVGQTLTFDNGSLTLWFDPTAGKLMLGTKDAITTNDQIIIATAQPVTAPASNSNIPGTLAYTATTLNEAATNDGKVTETTTVTLTGDTFTTGANATFTGVPAGLTPVFTIVDTTHGTISLTGSAAAHENANDANFTVAFEAADFTSAVVPTVATQSIGVNFADAASGATESVTIGNTTPGYDASINAVTFNFTQASYDYYISGFDTGDVLNVLDTVLAADSVFISPANFVKTDGKIDLQVIDSASNTTINIHLIGVALEDDAAVFNFNSFKTTFGAASVI